MADVIIGETRTYYGKAVPLRTVRIDDVPDPRRAYGYHRILHIVESHAPEWVELELGHQDLAKRVADRLRKHQLRNRYEIINAHDRVFIRAVRIDLRDLIRGKEDSDHSPGTDASNGVGADTTSTT